MNRVAISAPITALGLPLMLALTAVPAAADDPRLVERLYNPDEVVRINGRIKVQATIRFDAAEKIENVAIGDSNAWQVTPNKRANLLFVKPLSPAARTNLTVITDRHTYLFDLVASPRARPLYVLSFTYPEAPASRDETQLAQQGSSQQANASASEMEAATDPYAVVDPAQLNYSWVKKGTSQILPEQAYDDGDATFLTWPQGAPVPAILIRDAKGTEGPVNFTVRGETIVVQGVPRLIILRSGRNTATLTNTGPVRAPRVSDNAALAISDANRTGDQ